MKKIKKLLCTLAAMILLLSTANIAMANDEIKVKLDDKYISFDVQPQIINERTMVPLRAIFEALGATVDWDGTTQTVTSVKNDITIKMTIASPTMYVNEKVITLDSPACLVDERTLVPVRAISEAFGLRVDWNQSEKTVLITSNVLEAQPTATAVPTPVPTVKPTPAPSTNTLQTVYHNEYSFEPTREFRIECTNVIRGERANSIVHGENMYNDEPAYGQEWVIMEFNVDYIWSSAGENDEVEASDIIYQDTFFTESKSSIPVYDMATLGDKYGAYGVFKVDMYPGSSSKVVIGLLTNSDIGNILLKVPNKNGNAVSWLECGNSSNLSSGTTSQATNNGSTVNNQNSSIYYSGTNIPTYTSITGVKLKSKTTLSSGSPVYMYKYTSAEDVGDYWAALTSRGWKLLEGDDKTTSTTFESGYYKGSDIIIINVYLDTNEVWITY